MSAGIVLATCLSDVRIVTSMLGWSLPNDCAIVIEMSRKAGSRPGTLVPFVGTLVYGAGIQWFPGSEYSTTARLNYYPQSQSDTLLIC